MPDDFPNADRRPALDAAEQAGEGAPAAAPPRAEPVATSGGQEPPPDPELQDEAEPAPAFAADAGAPDAGAERSGVNDG